MKLWTLIAACIMAAAVFGMTFGAVWEDGIDRALLAAGFGAILGFGTTFWIVRIFTD